MRTALAIALTTLLSACSVLDDFEFNSQTLDPNRIYLGTARVTSLSAREVQEYACVSGPLICDQRGIGFDCRCY